MRLGIRDIDWKQVGAMLAESDDKNQADFFKSFVKECNSWETKFQIEMQLVGINQLLTEEEKQILAMISFKD